MSKMKVQKNLPSIKSEKTDDQLLKFSQIKSKNE